MIPPKPITLATLNESTAQEVFDWVAFNLLRQNARSVNNSANCMYRGPDGLKCAAGWLIADDEYDPKYESATWPVVTSMMNEHFVHDKLIYGLQLIHDNSCVEAWADKLRSIAYGYRLDPRIVNEMVTE